MRNYFLIKILLVLVCVGTAASWAASTNPDLSVLRDVFDRSKYKQFFQDWSDDYYTSTNGGETLRQGTPSYPTEPGISFLAAWMCLDEERYRQAAVAQFDFAYSRQDSNGLLILSDGAAQRDPQARQIYNFYTAYRLLGDSKYLQWADEAAQGMIDGIPRASHSYGGNSYDIFSNAPSDQPWEGVIDLNQDAETALAYTLLYHDSASSFYRSSVAEDIAENEINAVLALQNPSTGALPLTESNSDEDTAYGSYTLFSLTWANQQWNDSGWTAAITDAGNWISGFSSGTGQVADRYYPWVGTALSHWDMWYRMPALWELDFQPYGLVDRWIADYAPEDSYNYFTIAYFELMGIPPEFYLSLLSKTYDFEAPTYLGSSNGTVALAGQDGWTADYGVANAVMNVASGHVIPAGDQAAYLSGYGYARHSLAAITFADGTEFSWLQRVYADWNTTDLNNGDGYTYTEVTFEADGSVYALSGGSGSVDTGVTWTAGLSGGDTFKVREVLDFTNQRYNVFLTNLTAGTPEVDTGWYNFWTPTTAEGASGGDYSEVLLRLRSGGTYDNVEITTPAYCFSNPQGDLNSDCKVDIHDLLIMVSNWLDCNVEPQTACFN